MTHLGTETHKKTVLACEARAQVATDILVRNLFERTADIGFLAADDIIRRYARDLPGLKIIASVHTRCPRAHQCRRRTALRVASCDSRAVSISPLHGPRNRIRVTRGRRGAAM